MTDLDLLRKAAACMREHGDMAWDQSWDGDYAADKGWLAPPVALAVADWLDAAVDEPWCCDECKFSGDNALVNAAVDLARAYLGAE